ncbi:MAG TPA: hypothetical protein EYG92_11190 [Lutibacter sp.]|nr:hypothetical protein [Lutibacter sp.]
MNISYLENVAAANKSLIIWFSNIEQMHKGIQMFSEENILQKENTQFGKWYTGEGQIFSSFESFRAIEEPYNSMYSKYIEYIELYNQPIKKGLFSNNEKKRKSELSVILEEIKTSKNQLINYLSFFETNLKQSLLFKKESEKEKITTVSDENISTNKVSEEEIIEVESSPIESDSNQEITINPEVTSTKEIGQLDKPKIENESKEIDIEEEIRRILS